MMLGSTTKLGRNVMLLAIALSICLALSSCTEPILTPTSTQAPESTATAEFEVTSLVLAPTEVVVGEAVSVKADITNVGEAEGTYTATLTVDGKVADTKEIMVGAGATETVSFT